MTPGVNISVTSDAGDQRYVSPRSAVVERGADLIIVGRGVTRAGERDQVLEAVNNYRQQSWPALTEKYLL